ncbi:hypothetical protein D3Z51_01935 [Clostridiaceae bacterium]|nr:hypothetical protein [Clostridiaceae bacterium]RKI18287.1 hypothetical protein D7V81_00065 [bacterium 1XD21-70]
MKKNCLKPWSFAIISFITMLAMTFPSSAAPARGKVTGVDSGSISGWAWNPEDTNDVQQVELHIFRSGKPDPVKYLHVAADQYREDLAAELKDGWHGFSVKVDWSGLEGSDFKIKAYTVKDGEYYVLGEPVSYSKGSSKAAKSSAKDTTNSKEKPAAEASASSPAESSQPSGSDSSQSLGVFSISGYCNCDKCSGGSKITYSGKVPQAGHTIAADLTILPLGSRVRIGNTVYTVEDKGSAIQGHKIDIFYDSHEKARAHGRTSQEVFLLR